MSKISKMNSNFTSLIKISFNSLGESNLNRKNLYLPKFNQQFVEFLYHDQIVSLFSK